MNRKLLRKVAKIHGVSVAEVRRDMQAYVDYAFNDSKIKPTPEEVVNYAVRKVKSTE